MKTVKLILGSLFNNNRTIDGARKKPWYFAIIIFFFSLVISVVPTLVQYAKTKGDETISTYGYLTQEALQDYKRNVLDVDGNSITIVYSDPLERNQLQVAGVPTQYDCVDHANSDKVYFRFYVRDIIVVDEFKDYSDTSYMVFGTEAFFLHLVDPNTGKEIRSIACQNAWKNFDNGYNFKDATNSLGDFRSFLRKAYNYNRLTNLWIQTAILAGVNFIISLVMGLLVFVLTRGKNNVYRCFKVWECLKIVAWGSLTPSLLSLILGFIFARFATISFALLIGIRIMWLTSKSLRPDGSGYAAD